MMPTDSETTNILLSYFHKHPIAGAIISIMLAIYGSVIPILHIEIPIIVMQCLQIIVWIIGGTAGIFTIIGFFKRSK